MDVDTRLAATTAGIGGTIRRGITGLAVSSTLLLVAPPADSAGGGGMAPVGENKPVRLETIEGTTVKRVILTAKAAERLGIDTAKVDEQSIVRKQIVGGRVTLPVEYQPPPTLSSAGFSGFAQIGAVPQPQSTETSTKPRDADETWVLVTLSKGEWDRLNKDAPARVLPLATRDRLGTAVPARLSGMPPLEDLKRSMLKLYYILPGKDHGLSLYERVRVELPLSGSGESRKVIPYGAIYYDAEGTAWVYVNPARLVFERRRVDVERIVGDTAILADGPPVGTSVVNVGTALLYGAEVVFGK